MQNTYLLGRKYLCVLKSLSLLIISKSALDKNELRTLLTCPKSVIAYHLATLFIGFPEM